ncbi:MAG: zinc ABC transporter substrate-binding protein [Bifidobacteriaceae bacterium]|jgi:zinc/manganese transport system substrate-binding protein|nr:zinc ABC transporter substrate-binding protein [Bifidobacteriaceae bacterium]
MIFRKNIVSVVGVVSALALLPVLAGCSDQSNDAGGECGSNSVTVVSTIYNWDVLVGEINAPCVQHSSILEAGGDPHEFEPSAADIEKVKAADLVIVNGMEIDEWAAKAVDTANQKVITAIDFVGDNPNQNPHAWFSFDAIKQVTQAVSNSLTELYGTKSITATVDLAAVNAKIEPVDAEINSAARDSSVSCAYTENLLEFLLRNTNCADGTPQGYKLAAQNESEPTAQDVDAFLTLLDQKKLALLVNNNTEASPVTEKLVAAAETAGIPVLNVTETIPDNFTSLIDWWKSIYDEVVQLTSTNESSTSSQ